jgi:hypothetical protein
MLKLLLSKPRVLTPHDEWAAEREKVARKRPEFALVPKDPRPDPDMFAWRDPAELWERRNG